MSGRRGKPRFADRLFLKLQVEIECVVLWSIKPSFGDKKKEGANEDECSDVYILLSSITWEKY